MWRDLAVGTLLAGAVFATGIVSANACKGATELLRDDFTKLDPAWNQPRTDGSFEVSGNKMLLRSKPNNLSTDSFVEYVEYGNAVFPEADVCVSVVLPPTDASQGHNFDAAQTQNIFAGLAFVTDDGSIFIASINFGFQRGKMVSVMQLTSNGLLSIVDPGTLDTVKPGVRASNTLRLTWKGPPAAGAPADSPGSIVSFYVNDKLYTTFPAPPNANRKIGLAAATAGGTAEFAHLLVTK
jgi:hypothetical protein